MRRELRQRNQGRSPAEPTLYPLDATCPRYILPEARISTSSLQRLCPAPFPRASCAKLHSGREGIGMEWSPGEVSEDVEDRRRSSGGGFGFGGGGLGIVGFVVLLIIS